MTPPSSRVLTLSSVLLVSSCAHLPATDPQLMKDALFLEAKDIAALEASGPPVLLAFSSAPMLGPAYTVIVRTTGLVEYFGRGNVTRDGYASRALKPTQVTLLRQLVRKADVMGGRDSYGPQPHELTVLYVWDGERTKRIEDPHLGPFSLRRLSDELSAVLGIQRWATQPRWWAAPFSD